MMNFNQLYKRKSGDYFNGTKLLNPNWPNRRSAEPYSDTAPYEQPRWILSDVGLSILAIFTWAKHFEGSEDECGDDGARERDRLGQEEACGNGELEQIAHQGKERSDPGPRANFLLKIAI